jgi:hypothetical protein
MMINSTHQPRASSIGIVKDSHVQHIFLLNGATFCPLRIQSDGRKTGRRVSSHSLSPVVIGLHHFHIEAVPLQALQAQKPGSPQPRHLSGFFFSLFLDDNPSCHTELPELSELPRGDAQTILRQSAYYCLFLSPVNC